MMLFMAAVNISAHKPFDAVPLDELHILIVDASGSGYRCGSSSKGAAHSKLLSNVYIGCDDYRIPGL